MGLHWSDLNPVHGIQHAIEHANNWGHKWFGGGPGHEDEGGTDWYVGYNSNNGIQTYVNTGQTQYKQPTQPYTPKPRPNSGYSRNVAATAKDIAQGGMTKDEVIEFNIKHPNETAKRSE